jgi:hypothetical protein
LSLQHYICNTFNPLPFSRVVQIDGNNKGGLNELLEVLLRNENRYISNMLPNILPLRSAKNAPGTSIAEKASDNSNAKFLRRLLGGMTVSRRNGSMRFVSNLTATLCILLFYGPND